MRMEILGNLAKIGGWGCDSGVSATPEPGNRFRLRLRLRCVRACERAKLRARDDSSVARVGRRDLWVSVRPSVRPGAGPDQKLELFEFRPMIRDRVELLSVPVWWSRCVVCVSCVFRGGVRCWIVVLDPRLGLAPSAFVNLLLGSCESL